MVVYFALVQKLQRGRFNPYNESRKQEVTEDDLIEVFGSEKKFPKSNTVVDRAILKEWIELF